MRLTEVLQQTSRSSFTEAISYTHCVGDSALKFYCSKHGTNRHWRTARFACFPI